MKKEQLEILGYMAPKCAVVNLEAEGILCASGEYNDGSVIDDFVEIDYDGWV